MEALQWAAHCGGVGVELPSTSSGMGGALAIQGIPEVTNRLRSKVENYAIYSALFLSFSAPSAMDLPPAIGECDIEEWSCVINKRMFMYIPYP